jgi:hypothetical protein
MTLPGPPDRRVIVVVVMSAGVTGHAPTLGFGGRVDGLRQTGSVARWEDLERAAPELARAGHRLLYQYGLGLAFRATVRPDGGPRLHPFCPIVTEGGLWGFIGPSPKRVDLRRDGRVAVHSFPPRDVDDEFYVQSRAVEIDDSAAIKAVRAAYTAPIQGDDELLFEILPERALLATYGPRPSWPPTYTRWVDRA